MEDGRPPGGRDVLPLLPLKSWKQGREGLCDSSVNMRKEDIRDDYLVMKYDTSHE